MKYQVPQFIEVEDKIFGPFTFKQFIYLAGGAGICFVLYRTLPIFFSIFLIVPLIAFTLALAFYRVNGQPFIKILEYAFFYLMNTKLYLWKKEASRQTAKKDGGEEGGRRSMTVPAVSQNKLKDLAWSLDIHEKVRKGNEEINP